jgi:hypothetical protein
VGAEDDPGPEIGYTGARFGGTPRRKARKRKAAAEAPSEEEMAREAAAREAAFREAVTEVFGTVGSAPAREDAPEDTAEHPGGSDVYHGPVGDDSPVVGYTGARFGGAPRRRRKPAPDQEQEAAQQEESPRTVVVPVPSPLPDFEPREGYFDPASSSSVRPYVFTRGRTRSHLELSLEALVSVVPSAPTGHMNGEHHSVLGLCREPRSVAEIAALLDVPLGVARVLVGDLAAAGAVALHRTAGAVGPDLALMERVLSGLRRL